MRSMRMMAAALVAPIALAACDGGSPFDDGRDGRANLSVLLTDAPGDVEAVWVDIGRISLIGDAGTVDLLDEETGLIELTELVGTTELLIDDETIDAGRYRELRVFLNGAVLESASGKVFVLGDASHPDGFPATGTLKCPSCSQTGLKIKLGDGGVEFDGEAAVVLDFDVAQSFGHEAGKSGMWVMHPVIHATVLDDVDEGATAAGTVVLASGVTVPECPAGTPRSLADFVPTMTATTLLDAEDEPLVRTATVGTDGTFRIDFLAPDTYALGYLATTDLSTHRLVWTAAVSPASVTIADDEDDEDGVVYTVGAVTCEAL